jgi:predicted N-acetyltransferase YhbS
MDISIRRENENDYRASENLTREAFWDLYRPGCSEHLVLHKLRNSPAFVKELCFVACDGDTIVGNIAYSKAKVVGRSGAEHEVLCMGPLGVLPSYQKKGVGTRLLKHSISAALELGYKGIIIFGSPDYYGRFGFVNAEKFRITTSDGKNFDPFMALELSPGSLGGVSGKFHEDPVFSVDDNELEQFEKNFPFREKHVTDTQLF